MPSVQHSVILMCLYLESTYLSNLSASKIYSQCMNVSQLMWQICGVTYTLLQPRLTMGRCWLTCASHLALAQVCVMVHIQTTPTPLIYTLVLHNLDKYYFPYYSHPSISHTLLFSPPFSRSPQHSLKSQMALPFVYTCYPRGYLSLLMS